MEINIAGHAIVKLNMKDVILLIGNFYDIIHVPHGFIFTLEKTSRPYALRDVENNSQGIANFDHVLVFQFTTYFD